jgi:hypothetical protein
MLILGHICWLGAPNKSLTPGNCFNDGSLSWNGFIASQLSELVCGLFTFSLLETRWFSTKAFPGPQNYTHDAVCFIAKVKVKKEGLHFCKFSLVWIWQNSEWIDNFFSDFVKILHGFLNIPWIFHLVEPIHSDFAATIRPKGVWSCILIPYNIARSF